MDWTLSLWIIAILAPILITLMRLSAWQHGKARRQLSKTFLARQLDPSTRDYLQRIWDTGGIPGNGVLIRARQFHPLLRIVAALIILGVVIYLCRPPATGRFLSGGQTLLSAFGVLMFVSGVRASLGRSSKHTWGEFTYVDVMYLWQVTPERVEALPIDEIVLITKSEATVNGQYSCSHVTLILSGGVFRFVVNKRELANEFCRYVMAVLTLRGSMTDGSEAPDAAALSEKVARMLGHYRSRNRIAMQKIHGNIPTLPESSSDHGSIARRAQPLVIVGIVLICGWIGFPALNRSIYHRHLFAQIPDDEFADLAPLYNYLVEFPDGRHADQVRTMCDDRTFVQAERALTKNQDPSGLREYLAKAANVRHRRQAKKSIDQIYDQAIAATQRLADRENANPELFKGLLALLEVLKSKPKPVVSVRFQARQDPEPVEELHKIVEKLAYRHYLKEQPFLHQFYLTAKGREWLAKHGGVAPNASDLDRYTAVVKGLKLDPVSTKRSDYVTAIRSHGRVFDGYQTSRRESVILDQLRTSFRNVIDTKLLDFGPTEKGAQPMLIVAYHIYSQGELYLCTETTRYEGLMSLPQGISSKDLLRKYHIRWTISIRPLPDGESYIWQSDAEPAPTFTSKSNFGDPSWAPYAVILYSAFNDTSNKLIQNFGMRPPPARTKFTFAEAVGQPVRQPKRQTGFPPYSLPLPQGKRRRQR